MSGKTETHDHNPCGLFLVRSVFMGILQQLPTDPEEATVWLMANGQILSCDMIFTDWLGYRQEDLHMSECIYPQQLHFAGTRTRLLAAHFMRATGSQ